MLVQRILAGFKEPPLIDPPNITLKPNVRPMANPANGPILLLAVAAVVKTMYTNVNVITISSINALKTLPSDGRVTLEEIEEPNIAKTTAAAIIPPIIEKLHRIYHH